VAWFDGVYAVGDLTDADRDGIGTAGVELIAGIKGRTMLVEPWAALFDAADRG